MNIFILDENIEKCAQYHCDKHIIKMILESAQLLCTAHWINKYAGFIPRKITKVKNGKKLESKKQMTLVIFLIFLLCITTLVVFGYASSLDNYEWLYRFTDELNKEYGYRYGGKSHKSMHDVIAQLPVPRYTEAWTYTLCTRYARFMQRR